MMISYHYLTTTVLLLSSHLLHRASANLRGGDFADEHHHEISPNRILQQSQEAVYLIKEIEYEGDNALGVQIAHSDRPRHTKNIELPDGTIYEIANAPAGWDDNLQSGKYKIEIPPGAVISSDGTIDVKGKKLISSAIKGKWNHGLFDRSLEAASDTNQSESTGSRNLQLSTVSKTVLVVRVFLTDGAYNYVDQTTLSNDVFGNGVDLHNLKSQYAACSANQLIFEKTPNRVMTLNPNDGTTAINNGVVDIKVDVPLSSGDSTIRNAVTTKINSVFGVTSPDKLANHVMYCMPPGAFGGIAYAYPNSWMSVYSNEWCSFLSAQMHEIGHNLGFGHSGEGGATYDDVTGMMGYSYGVDDGPVKCFNAAKSWQSQWYSSKSRIVDPSAGNCFDGKLYGVADYGNAAASVVLVKIDDMSDVDFYIAFNRKIGINTETGEAENLVTVVRAPGEGINYSNSELLAKLNVGGTWSGIVDGKNMLVNVVSINTSVSPAYAQIRISQNGNVCPAGTSSPTNLPTSKPTTTASPTSRPPSPPPSSIQLDIPATSTPTALPTSKPASPTRKPTTRRPTRKPTMKPI